MLSTISLDYHRPPVQNLTPILDCQMRILFLFPFIDCVPSPREEEPRRDSYFYRQGFWNGKALNTFSSQRTYLTKENLSPS